MGVASVDTERFTFPLETHFPNSISEAVRNRLSNGLVCPDKYDKYLSDEIIWRIKWKDFLSGQYRCVEVKYRCDIFRSFDQQQKLTEESFMDFKYFIKTANAILASNF